MVVGKPLDPLVYVSDQALADAYYTQLHQLFEEHKSELPAYAGRTIEWKESNSNAKSAKSGDQSKRWLHIALTCWQFTFLGISMLIFVKSGKFLRFSTLGFFPGSHVGVLGWHMLAALLWTITAAFQTIKRGYYHKSIGYLALLSNVAMCGTAFHLASLDLHRAPTQDYWTAVHSIFHAQTNMMVAGGTQLLLAYALAAAISKDLATHKKFMAMVHLSMGVSFAPRVTQNVFRWLLPFVSSHGIYSIAAGVHYMCHTKLVLCSKQRQTLMRLNSYVFVGSLVFVLVELWLTTSPISGVAGPAVFFSSGLIAYSWALLGETSGMHRSKKKSS